MKTVNIFLTAAMMIAAFGCGGGKSADGVMTMTTYAGEVRFELMGSGSATIDWDNGSETVTINDEWLEFSRELSDENPGLITITGGNITGLRCSDNQLTELDVSRNKALTELYCDNNRELHALDVSRNIALTRLWCFANGLSALDVSANTALEQLYCGDNYLSALDVSQNIALTQLYCHYNRLSALDVSRNTVLTELSCGNNQLTAEALNDLFATLHDKDFEKAIKISANPGSAHCDPAIAQAKGWTVEGFTGALTSGIPAGSLEEMIITTIKAFQNQDEKAINQLLHPNFGIVFLVMPGIYRSVAIEDKISFEWYYTMSLGTFTLGDYTVRFEDLPHFDCDEWKWTKPSGIYCARSNYMISLSDMAKSVIEQLELEEDPEMIKKLEDLESQSDHCYVTVIGAAEEAGDYIDFVLTLISGKWYLTVIDVTGYCGA